MRTLDREIVSSASECFDVRECIRPANVINVDLEETIA